jgi:ubiquinone/menaquinone biosynthesis C-methylase UbiE
MPDYATSQEIHEQRKYYERTADRYNSVHVKTDDEHGRALGAFMGLAQTLGPVTSVLDVGAGTGRALKRLKSNWPNVKIVGIEPVEALREVGYRDGLAPDELVPGDALNLAFDDDAFDYVIETGVLHHIARPALAVKEMARVAKKGVMISDTNNIGQGGPAARKMKHLAKTVGLWPLVVWLQTRGKMYKSSEGDGVYYSFSAFDCVRLLSEKFPEIHYMNTERCDGFDLYRGTSHVMILARK